MIRNIVNTSFLLLIPAALLLGQRSDVHKLILNDLYPGEGVETFDLRERKDVSACFFRDEWLYGVILFEDDRKSGAEYTLKYDMLNQELVVRMDNYPFVIPMHLINGFVLKDRNPGKVSTYQFRYHELVAEHPGAELALHLTEGHFTLVKYFYVEVLPATYVPALDAGSLDKKPVIRENYFLIEDGQATEIPKVRGKAKKFFARFEHAKAYIKEEKPDLKKEEDLISLVEMLNQSYLKNSKT